MMKNWLHKIAKVFAYLAAAVVILLAIAVGLFRLMLPRLPEYQEQIKAWASSAIGMQVEFSEMNARWRLSGPELSFHNAALSRTAADVPLLTVEEVSVGVSLVRLLTNRELVADRIFIRDAEVTAVLTDNYSWIVQGVPIDDLISSRAVAAEPAGDISLIAKDILVHYQHPGVDQVLTFVLGSLEVQRAGNLTTVDADVKPPLGFGDQLKLSASRRQAPEADSAWQFFIEGDAFQAAAWSVLQPEGLPDFVAGTFNTTLWLQLSSDGVKSATANFVINDLAVEDASTPFSASGRLEYSRASNGWLVSASDFSFAPAQGLPWPKASWQVQASQDASGEKQSMSVSATYLRLQDLNAAAPWLSRDWQEQLKRFAPDGAVTDFSYAQSGLNTESPAFELTARLDAAGLSAVDKWPGVRGFSGSLRADTAGGRLEIASDDLDVSLPAELPEPVHLDDARGTIIWRRNAEGMIVLSDSVHLSNADLTSQSSLQIGLPADGTSPIVDLQSNWTINDISRVDRYLPRQSIKPPLYRWLTEALVSGRIPRASARLAGPLDRFPFDGDEGVFRIDARVENAVLRYSDQWPAATNMNLDIVVDKTRLYSYRNSAVNVGNNTEDARIEIADLRVPVLEINAFATGTLESIKAFSQRSPIDAIFGGQLERIEVDGDASFDLHLIYPIANKNAFDFETRIRSSNGSLRIEGFPAPITALEGLAIVSRNDIRAEKLTGRFLGEAVNIDLGKAGKGMPDYTVVATANGRASAAAIVSDLGVPLDGYLTGATPFAARLYFPAGKGQSGAPFKIVVESGLQGFGVELPAPLHKEPAETASMSATIEIPRSDRIESHGSFNGKLNWSLAFQKLDNAWDFDRGIVAIGTEGAIADETRGLHIEGKLDELRLADWLALAKPGSGKSGIGNRIRSIDLTIGNLDAIGQDLTAQHVIVNRSSKDWVVQLDGEQAVGTLTVPYDFSGVRPLALDMKKLILPGKAESVASEYVASDPRQLPPILLAADEFAFGVRHLGKVRASFQKTPKGIEALNFTARDESFAVDGSAGWVVDEANDTVQRSYVTAKLKSSDVAKTMQRLSYAPGIVGQDMEIDVDVQWSGGPRPDYLKSLEGDVVVRLGSGQLDDVEPGPGRVFGLMSIVALPRRLSLDFSDVFEKGFGFDEITGRFRIVDGDAFTCDLSLKSPAADVGIVGRAGLVNGDYSQTAVVSANVGNTLPIFGAFVAGPQVAAALLIFSQIFKKPIQEIGQVYYAIDGSWEKPLVESSNADHFASSSRAAGCLQISD
jgi:uncharacterized protein (TIGR02099 family)